MNYELTERQRALRDLAIRHCQKKGIELEIITCPFKNDDIQGT